MDRELNITHEDAIIAKLVFDYDEHGTGTIYITLNSVIYFDGVDGVALRPSVYPMYQFEERVYNQRFNSVADMEQYDRALYLGKCDQYNMPCPKGAVHEYIQPYECRYVLGDPASDLAGIATVTSDMEKDQKTLGFISARRKRDDIVMETVFMEPNIPFIARIFETYSLGNVRAYSKVNEW